MTSLNASVNAASALKDEGNALLLDHLYTEAVKKYSEAIEVIGDETADDETKKLLAILLSNRAQAYIKTEAYGLAVRDASSAIKADPKYPKGYYRRATAGKIVYTLK